MHASSIILYAKLPSIFYACLLKNPRPNPWANFRTWSCNGIERIKLHIPHHPLLYIPDTKAFVEVMLTPSNFKPTSLSLSSCFHRLTRSPTLIPMKYPRCRYGKKWQNTCKLYRSITSSKQFHSKKFIKFLHMKIRETSFIPIRH